MTSYRERASRVPGAAVWTVLSGAGPHRVLPDGCMDVLFYREPSPRLVIAGPDTTAHIPEVVPGTRTTGLRFAPGAAPAVLGIPADELTDRRVPLEEVWPARLVRELAGRLAESPAPGALLEEIALGRGTGAAEPLVAALARAMAAGRPVPETARELGLSERQLRRRSQAAFGYGPKRLSRVLRLGRGLDLVRAGTPAASAAAALGWADQAHFARDVRELTGLPLRRLLAP
ncbi:AraC family transcriptional regulator [Mangrovactinospora gilvigrisea]|uniref:AraC family transcriptional regulator n=1 Tax=Mangrovactinospora gilvigrisea TaxID=1428644 RepID=A0A1J7BAV1_9ACTN|nr:helix-turn-helix domain-containing protein [Mangrovactinospora gilvigrisea]OIV35741.1 AraC family transcriptional regulator [Mangrovactinospora gilvigrisea]